VKQTIYFPNRESNLIINLRYISNRSMTFLCKNKSQQNFKSTYHIRTSK